MRILFKKEIFPALSGYEHVVWLQHCHNRFEKILSNLIQTQNFNLFFWTDFENVENFPGLIHFVTNCLFPKLKYQYNIYFICFKKLKLVVIFTL